MNSLSDSQNIDLDPEAATPLPPTSAVQACPACTVLVDISGTEPLDQISCPRCAAAFAVHGQIAHYRIIEIAGRGGMGVVYRAYDSSLERDVALKFLRKDHSDNERLVQQLETEAGITATVNDPQVVRVYGTGFDRGRFYIVMELAGRGSLEDLMRLQGRVAEAQVLQVGIQVAKGLRAALQAGLIHRDVKPGNILFVDAQSAKIVDFGLAIFMTQEESVRGELWGSPYYVAPEKIDQQPEDFRSDMYSLGGTLFHALAGRPPFEAETGSLVVLKHLKSQPVSLQSFAPWVSNCTAHIINRCLLKDPAQRYQSYDELIESFDYALEQLRAQDGQAAPKVRVAIETAEDQRRLSRVVLAMIAIMVLLAIGFFAIQSKHANDARTRAAAGATVRAAAKLAALQEPIEALAALRPDAAELFAKAAADPALSPNERAWAQLLEGAACLAGTKSAEAREAFERVAPLAARMPDAVVGGFIQKTAARLTTTEPVSPAATQLLSTSNHEAVAVLLYGLHDWSLGKTDDAVALLRQFRGAKPAGKVAWLETLQPVATTLIERRAKSLMAAERLKNAPTAAATPAAAVERAKPLKFPAEYNATVAALKPIVHAPLDTLPTGMTIEPGVQFAPTTFAFFTSPASRIGSRADKLGTVFSVSLWFWNERPNNASGVTAYLFSRGRDGDKLCPGDHFGIGGKVRSAITGRLMVFNGDASKQLSIPGPTVIPPLTWNHAVFIRDGKRVRVYLNGEAKPEIDVDLEYTGPGIREFFLGARCDHYAPLQGNLAQFALFDRALTAAEAKQLHTASGQPTGTPTAKTH